MRPWQFMLIAGECSGDTLAAELVTALRPAVQAMQSSTNPEAQPLFAGLAPRFFGAGGPAMARAGVEVSLDLTRHAVIGLADVLKHYLTFRKILRQLTALAIDRRPDAIILVDFSGFNRRFARGIRNHLRGARGAFHNWNPRIIQYVSPQVWASRAGRAQQIARDYDLLLSIFPFEQRWYQERLPKFPVAFVGHPLIDRFARTKISAPPEVADAVPEILLLPGSRQGELRRHLPVMLAAAALIQAQRKISWRMVVPSDTLAAMVETYASQLPGLAVQVGGLTEALPRAALAIASTGTVSMECAYFGVPTVAIYIASWSTYQIGKRIIRVRHLAMPNILAGESLFPELIQHQATPENIARETLELLNNPGRRSAIKAGLVKVIASLGPGGAADRAAAEIVKVLLEPGCD